MPNRKFQRLMTATLLLVAVGCAHHASPDNSARTNRAVITEAEIPATGSESALDMIQRLRPEYLRPKPSQTYSNGSASTAPPPTVFLNGQRLGELADLRQIAAQSLSGVRYYNIEEAKRKFGMQYGGGVIEITYRSP